MKFFITHIVCMFACANLAVAEVVEVSAPEKEQNHPGSLPEGEARIRGGIILLGNLCQNMAAINDYNSAETAVPGIMRLCEELKLWMQSFNSLAPLTELEAQVYEERYLPTIRKINNIIEAQAERLGAAEYYGSKNLPAALVRLAQVGHN